MKEIKFRLMLGGQWHYWGFIEHHGEPCFAGIPSSNLEPCSIKELREKSQQYTGLKDKNGKEIYEGDIIRNHWWDINKKFIGADWVVKFGEYDDSEIEWGSPGLGFYCESKGGEQESPINLGNDKGIEIIGNIYENPELKKCPTNADISDNENTV